MIFAWPGGKPDKLSERDNLSAVRLCRIKKRTRANKAMVMPAPASTPAARRRASSRSECPGFPLETCGNDERERDQLRESGINLDDGRMRREKKLLGEPERFHRCACGGASFDGRVEEHPGVSVDTDFRDPLTVADDVIQRCDTLLSTRMRGR